MLNFLKFHLHGYRLGNTLPVGKQSLPAALSLQREIKQFVNRCTSRAEEAEKYTSPSNYELFLRIDFV